MEALGGNARAGRGVGGHRRVRRRPARRAPTDPPAPTPAATIAPSPTPTSGPLLVAAPTALPSGLPQLTIRGVPSDLPKYDRDDWRQWVDDDGDCQNARHETLVEESRIAVTFTNEERCSVATGEWLDPFTGDILTSARDLDVDHMVPLSNAHRSGAWAWDDARRRAYANDLSYANHLIAVTNSVNRAKSDQGPERWKPPDESYWCQYATDWANIKAAWGLSATQAEWDALLSMTATCDGQPPPAPTPPTATLAPSWMVYASCDEAERAGVPRQRGSSGNGQGFPANLVPTARDGDGDGVVCERTGRDGAYHPPTPTTCQFRLHRLRFLRGGGAGRCPAPPTGKPGCRAMASPPRRFPAPATVTAMESSANAPASRRPPAPLGAALPNASSRRQRPERPWPTPAGD